MSLWGSLTGYLLDFPGFKGGTADDDPSTPSPTVRAWQPELKLVRALYGGFNALRAERQQYLPQHPAEEEKDYFIRSMRPTFYNAFARTIRALTGIAFRQPPTSVGVPPEIQKLYDDDIDNRGTAGDMFLRHTFLDALITGLTGIFVEMPTLDGENITRADELAAEIRPYWTMYSKDNIVSFRTVVEDGQLLLAQLVLREVVQVPQGDYGVKLIEQYRSFKRLPAVAPATADAAILWESWQRAQSGKLVSVGSGQLPTVTEIPFAPVYTEHTDFMDARPPLMDLANLNLLHYQMWSDLAHAAHIANVPVLFGVGIDENEIQIGPNRAILVKGGDASTTLRWLETTGASLGSTRALLSDLEEQMANLGLSMLQRKSRAAETAQKSILDRTEQDATLGAVVGDLENGIELALYFTAQYLGMNVKANPKIGGSLKFTRDFQLDPATAGQFSPAQASFAPEPKAAGETNNPKTTGTQVPAPTGA